MSANTDQLIAYYVARLIWQYQKPKAQGTIAILVKQSLADGLAQEVQDAFGIDTAVGAQLDIVGKYVGIPRNIGDPAPLPYFGFVDYAGGGNPHGFTSYAGGINTDGLFYEYSFSGTRNTDLNDTAYRLMIKVKIFLNSSDSTLPCIQELLVNILGGSVTVVDNRDMSLTYTVSVTAPVSEAVLAPYLPKPMGVRINISTPVSRITSGGDFRITSDADRRVLGLTA